MPVIQLCSLTRVVDERNLGRQVRQETKIRLASGTALHESSRPLTFIIPDRTISYTTLITRPGLSVVCDPAY